jgi:hypothetical protein
MFIVKSLLTITWLGAFVTYGAGDWRFWAVLVITFMLFPTPHRAG